jgi:hypothetical protein
LMDLGLEFGGVYRVLILVVCEQNFHDFSVIEVAVSRTTIQQ